MSSFHAACLTEASATDVFNPAVPATFNTVLTCYTDNANTVLLSIVAVFSLIILTF
jgi:hypothetical protein